MNAMHENMEGESHSAEMLEVEQLKNDALENIGVALKKMADRKPDSPPVVNVAAPAVNVAAPNVMVSAPAPSPPAAVTVHTPPPVRKWLCEVTERDRDDRIKKFTLTAAP